MEVSEVKDNAGLELKIILSFVAKESGFPAGLDEAKRDIFMRCFNINDTAEKEIRRAFLCGAPINDKLFDSFRLAADFGFKAKFGAARFGYGDINPATDFKRRGADKERAFPYPGAATIAKGTHQSDVGRNLYSRRDGETVQIEAFRVPVGAFLDVSDWQFDLGRFLIRDVLAFSHTARCH